MGSSFDPMALDKPTLALGEHGSWVLGDITESREKLVNAALADIDKSVEAYNGGGDINVASFVQAVGALAEAACESADGLAAKVVELYESEQIGAKGLRGLVEFIQEWLTDGLTAGEG